MRRGQAVGLRGIAAPDGGQSVAELALIVPLFAVTLLVVVNVLTFVQGATVFDRAVEQWTRANVANPKQPLPTSALPIWFVLGKNLSGRFQASCAVTGDILVPFDVRECRFTMYYTPWGAEALTALGMKSPPVFTRKKTVVLPHYRRAVFL